MGAVVGKGSSPGAKKLSKEDMSWFQHHTSHSTKAIEEMHAKFYKDYPRGGIYRHEFAKLLPAGLGTVHFLDHIFRFPYILDAESAYAHVQRVFPYFLAGP